MYDEVFVLVYDEMPECMEPATQNALILGVFMTALEAGDAARAYIAKHKMNGHDEGDDDDDEDDDDDDGDERARKRALRKELKRPSDETLQTRRGWHSGSCTMNFECLTSRIRIVRKSVGSADLHLLPPQSSRDNVMDEELDEEDREFAREQEHDGEEEEEEEKDEREAEVVAEGGAGAEAAVAAKTKTGGAKNAGAKRKRASK